MHIVGHSLGGLVARAAVLLDPTPFASLTLMASGPAQISASEQQRVELLRDALAVMDMAQVWDAIQAMEPPEEIDTADLDGGLDDREDLRRQLAAHPTGPADRDRPSAVHGAGPRRRAGRRTPARACCGAFDDTWPVPLLDDMAVAQRPTHGRSGSRALPNTDQPEQTALALAKFWDQTQE